MPDHLVDAHSAQLFLERLGKCYRHPGTLYLVGGTSLLLVARKESTFDIDVQFDVASDHLTEFIRCLRQVSRELGFPVEQASPDQFIPLPAGFENRRQFIGRYGSLDVFHFDFYSVALAKIHRGNEKDYADVVSMISTGLIDLQQLESYLEQILPSYEDFSPNADSAIFRRKFALLKAKLESADT
jgi:hypothetical protein